MHVLVTGGAGFIGRHVCRELLAHGHAVVVLDKLDPAIHPTRSWADVDLPRDVFRVQGDVGDESALRMMFQGGPIDAVIHLAAAVSVADSAARPEVYLEENSLATCEFLKAVRERHAVRPIQRLVVASSMSVYGEGLRGFQGRPLPCGEDDPCEPASVYGLTKFDQERLCLLFGEQLGIPTIALRLFNVYGPGQAGHNKLTGVLANWAAAIIDGERPRVHEDGEQTRDFVYVSDVARAFRLALVSPATGVFNVARGEGWRLSRVAAMLARQLGRPEIEPLITGEKRPGDVRCCLASTIAAEEKLGFTAEVSLPVGLRRYAQSLRK